MIVCGWCGDPTEPPKCGGCGRDPSIPWVQRDQLPPAADEHERERRLLAEAAAALKSEGRPVTAAALAERLEVDDRTVRRWQKHVRPVS